MLKIAVCDDEARDREKITASLEAYIKDRPKLQGRIQAFAGGHELLKAVNAGDRFDLYILDVIMPEPDGIQTGLKLRSLGEGGEIIYLTSSKEYAAESYNVRAFYYLLKPVKEEQLFEVLDAAIQKLKRRRSSAVLVSTPGGQQRVLLERILYVERVGRSMRYVCVDHTVDSQSIRVSFREMVAPLLADSRFWLCGASFVFNLEHVAGVNGQNALLDNGVTVPLPRTAATGFKLAWGQYWLGEEEE